MELVIEPRVGIGKFNLSAKLSKILNELKVHIETFGHIKCVSDNTNTGSIYFYTKKQGNECDDIRIEV